MIRKHLTRCKVGCTVYLMTEITLDVRNLLNFPTTASLLGVSRQTVYDLVEKQKLHPVEIGHNRYFLRNEVETLKKERDGKITNT